ncbi:hypothetical protein [Krasilnikovia sp. MM14-A1259]|uniref:hypothetical protein n=1 Tax=Krasilnikovia sp. MM14-A1259 TaxID=3373539 RepID=UPI00381ACA70
MSEVSLAFNAVGRDRGVSALLTRTGNAVRATNARSAASTIAMGAAMAFAGARAVALANAALSAAGAAAAIPAAMAAGAGIVGALRANTFGMAAAWQATGKAATGGAGGVSSAARQAKQSAEQVRSAQWALTDAKRAEVQATEALNKAREQEAQRLRDLSLSVAGSRLDEEAATNAVAKAAQDLAVARAGGSNYDIEQADLAYRQSQQTLAETKVRVQDLTKEQQDGARKGVEGSDAVQEALQRQKDAHEQTVRAAQDLADAQQRVGDTAAKAASGGIDPAAEALAKLSPNGRAVILMLRQLATAWQGAGRAGQQATFAHVAGDLQKLSGIYLPVATKWLTRMGTAFNLAIRQALGLASTKKSVADVQTVLDSTVRVTDRLARAIRPVVHGILQWVAVGAQFLPGLAGDVLTIAQRFDHWSTAMRQSGQAATWMRTGIALLRQVGTIANNVVHTVLAIVHAGGDGGQTLNFLVRASAALRKFAESAQGQQKIKQLFAVLRGALDQLGPLLSGVAAHSGTLSGSVKVLGSTASFAVNHLGPLVKLLPTLAAGYLLLKHSGISAGVGLGVKGFQIASQFAMSRAIKAHTAALRENTVASRTAAVATETNTAAESAGILTRARAVIGMVAQKVATVATTVVTRAYTAVQWLLNVAMDANPLGLIVLALAAVAAGLYLLWTHSATFRKIVTGAFNTVWGAIKTGWNWIKKNWPLLLGILTGPIGWAVLAITKNWTKIKNGATTVKDWIVARFDALTTWFGKLPGRIGKALSGLGRFLTAPFRTAFNGVAILWNRTLGGMSFTLPSWIPGVGGNSFSLPRIPYLAKGGIVPKTPGGRAVMAGDGGEDEAIVPLSRLGAVAGGHQVVEVRVRFVGNVEGSFKRAIRESMRIDALVTNAAATN